MSASSQRALVFFLVASVIALAAALLWPAGPEKEAATRAPELGETAAPSRPRPRAPAELPELPVAGLTGTVRDLEGAPLAGAYVCAWPLTPSWAPTERSPPVCVEAGPDGFYALMGLPPTLQAIHASAPRHRPARLEPDLSLRPGERRAGVDLALAPGGVQVTGVVQDLSGGVVEGAWVASGDGRGPGTAATRSDAAGRFVLWVRPGFAMLTGQAEGYADASDHGSAPGQGFVLVLTPESVLIGQVVAADTRAPLVGARVTAIGDPSEGGLSELRVAYTDSAGRFRLAPLQPGRYKPTAQAQGRHGEAERSVHVGLGETSDMLTIVAHPVATASGRIAVEGSSGGCPRGEVYLNSRTGVQTLVEATDSTGAVMFPAVRPGTYEVQVVCPGYVVPGNFPPVTVAQAPVTGLVWSVATGRAIRGTVVDAHGRGVAGLSVMAQFSDPMPTAQSNGFGVDEATDAAGRFEVQGLLPGQYLLHVHGEGLHVPLPPVSAVLTAARDVEDVQFTLPAQGGLHGVVVDERGDPVARVQVMIHGPDGMVTGTMTAGDGAFLMAGLPPGDYRLQAQLSGVASMPQGAPEPDEVQARVVEDGSTEVRLVVDGADETIRGRVLHADGSPVTDAFVRAVREQPGMDARLDLRWGGLEQPVLTDADGNFTLTGLRAGAHALRAYRRGGGEAIVEHVLAGATTNLTITPTAEIAGTLVGAAPDELAVYIIDNTTMIQRLEEFYRTAGRWGFEALPPGTYDLFFESADGAAKHTVTLRADEQRTDLRVTLASPGSVRGRVVAAGTDAPVEGLRVQASPLEGRTRFSVASPEVISDADGRFEIATVRAGPVHLFAHGAGQAGDMQVTVESGRSAEVTLSVTGFAPEFPVPAFVP